MTTMYTQEYGKKAIKVIPKRDPNKQINVLVNCAPQEGKHVHNDDCRWLYMEIKSTMGSASIGMSTDDMLELMSAMLEVFDWTYPNDNKT